MVFMLFFVVSIGSVNCLSYRQNLIRKLLNDSNYDDTLYPGVDDGHVTNVSISMHFYGIHSINEHNMDFSAEIFFQQRWEDQRLFYASKESVKKLYLVPEYIKEVWRPNVYFSNEKTAIKHTVPQETEVMYIYPNGTVVYNMRISVKYDCTMQFRLYPFDIQKCHITIESYSYTDDVVQLKWDEPAVDTPQSTELRHYIIQNPTRSEQIDVTPVGNFSSLSIHLLFARQPGNYILNLFIPSVFIVIMSWISFLIDPQIVNGRLALGSVTVLTMVSHYASVQKMVPSVSYVKAVDVWMIVCQFIVFSVLIEFAYVYYAYVFPGQKNSVVKNYESCNNRKADNRTESQQTSFNDTTEQLSMSVRIDKSMNEKVRENQEGEVQTDKVNCVDKWSRVVFPGVFILFVFIYSITYGVLANNQY